MKQKSACVLHGLDHCTAPQHIGHGSPLWKLFCHPHDVEALQKIRQAASGVEFTI